MITNGWTTVGLTPSIIDGTSTNNFRLIVHNADNTAKIHLGNASVTVSNGLELDANAFIQLDMNPMEEIYAVSEKTGHIITWLKQV